MRSIVCSLVFATSLIAQTAGDDKIAIGHLTSTLVGIGKADASRAHLSQRLADDMFAFAKRDHEPPRVVVVRFTEELTAALYGKELSNRSVGILQQSIRDVMRGATATFVSAAALRQILNQAGVDSTKAQLVTRNFMTIGEEIRGPDDLGGEKSEGLPKK